LLFDDREHAGAAMIIWDQDAILNPNIRRYAWVGACLYVAMHVLVTYFCASYYPSDFVLVALGLLKFAVCLWLFFKLSSFPTRFRWLFIAVAALLSNIATQIYIWRSLLLDNHTLLSSIASFLFALAAIPTLLAIALNFNKQESAAVRLMDAVLCLALGYLFFVMLFSPAGVGTSAVSTHLLINFEGGFLLACSAIRFLASDGAEERRFQYVFFVCLAVSIPIVAIRNRWNAAWETDFWNIPLDVPPLLFALLALNPSPKWVRNLHPPEQLVHMARGGSPVFMSLAIALLAIGVSHSNFYLGSACILLGIVSYGLRNAVIHGKLLETEDRLLIAQKELEIQASRDALTGIPNRRLFDETLRREWRNVVQRGGSLAVLMVDVDYFKNFNDVYGHPSGDACLIVVAKSIQEVLPRVGDFVGRFGGEEFAVLLPETPLDGALAVAERLRSCVMELAIPHAKSEHKYVTVSIGAAVGNAASIPDPSLLIQAADEALYRAKRAGRHRVETMDPTTLSNLLSETTKEP
jgi:diguanylate cyclase (GGDEF)-like protein